MNAGVGLEAALGRGAGLPCSTVLGAAPRSEPRGEAPRGGRRLPGPRVWPDVGERVRMREQVAASRSTRPLPCGLAAARRTRALREECSDYCARLRPPSSYDLLCAARSL